MNKKMRKPGKRIDHKKIARAYGVLRHKRLKPLRVERSLSNHWQ